jgi:hypothetical protein
MSVTESEMTVEAPSVYETCEHCEAPVESTQRYCVACGTRRKHVNDPAVRFLAEATSRSRTRPVSTTGARRPSHRSSGLGLALVLAAIPLAVAAGVLIGRPGSAADDKLLAALRNQKPTVVNIGGGQAAASTASGAAPGAAATPVARLKSDFGLSQGYTVELETLSGAGITMATATAAERRARARGAPAVGLVSPSDFTITPAPPAGDYVIYSGEYHSKAAATAALAKLRHAFPSAKVIALRSTAGASSGPVLARTQYGSAHQVSGFKPNAAQLSSGASVVNKVSKEINGGYVKSQQGLPDAVSIP